MGIKSTRTITRQLALEILLEEIPEMSNDVLGDLMDVLADSKQSKYTCQFDNFVVTEFAEEEPVR
jgi:hypothetical protein